ncbi:MAG: carbamoyltransferase N-terminal domain-containing protein, partial [Oscillospiraceae bacterium]
GHTKDDAAGEAFDKAGRVMDFPYPAGVAIDNAAKLGNKEAYILPRPKVDGYDMSFSGLKTAVMNLVNNSAQKGIKIDKNDLAASFQLAVCDIISKKLRLAVDNYGYDKLVIAGGVSANSHLRERLNNDFKDCKLYMPPLKYCGDNAAMVGAQAYYEYLAGNIADK